MSLSMVPKGELAFARTIQEIEPVFEAMRLDARPGFQIGPAVSIEDSLETLEALMQEINPGFSFDDSSLEYETDDSRSAAHIDGTYVEFLAGIAVHENKSGLGVVKLQLVKPGVTETSELTADDFVGPCLQGSLDTNIKTVFSEQLFDIARRRVILGATYHMFTSNPGSVRRWQRHTSSQDLRSYQ